MRLGGALLGLWSIAGWLSAGWLSAGCDGGGDPGERGQPCRADAECGALLCGLADDVAARDLEPLELSCDDAREGEPPHAECESAEDCDHGVCLLAGGCALPCANDADCDEQERCAEVFARAGDDALQSLTACVRRVDLPDDAELRFETMQDALEPETSELSLEPIAGRRTFFVLDHSDATWPGTFCAPPLCLRTLRGADGELLYDRDADYAASDPPLVSVATAGHIDPLVLRLPIEGEPGYAARYDAELEVEHAGDLTVTTIARRERGQLLDLHVFYVGELALAPRGERGPPDLEQALDAAEAILGQAGIVFGRVHQVAIGGELPMRGTYFPLGEESMGFTILHIKYGTYVELPGLFKLSAGAPGGGVNLFLLDDIEPLSFGAETQAESGGIPGPPAMHGTAGSGIAVAASMMLADPEAFGRTLAHELAHYLGLFHTSEQDGRVLDNLADTPECRLEQDAGRDGLDPADCEAHGADNLMFWAKSTGSVLTPEQRALLADSPILR